MFATRIKQFSTYAPVICGLPQLTGYSQIEYVQGNNLLFSQYRVRLIGLVFPSSNRIHTVLRTGRVNLRDHAIPWPKIIRTRRKPVRPTHYNTVISPQATDPYDSPSPKGPDLTYFSFHISQQKYLLVNVFGPVRGPYSRWLSVKHAQFQPQASNNFWNLGSLLPSPVCPYVSNDT